MSSVSSSPIARASDPGTSHAAAEALTRSGGRVRQLDVVLRAVLAHPGLTGTELGDTTGMGQVPAVRRLSELKNRGMVVQGAPVGLNGRRQVTWWPAPAEQLALL